MKKIIELIKKSSLLLKIVANIHNLIFLSFRLNFSRKNKIIAKGVFLRGTRFKIIGRGNEINIDLENRLNNCFFFIKGNNCKINIGKHCILNHTVMWVEDDFGSISIGGFTTIEEAHIAATEGESITIGEDCMFSHGIEIRNGDSHPIFDDSGTRINLAAPIQIGNHVWLGADVKVLKGKTIGDNSILGAGSIVTSNIIPDSIYVGVPAKKVKDSISWKRHRQ